MMMVTYAVYVAVSLGITVWVGRSLSKNGRVFLVENFEGKEALADSINHLLLVGFYLVNIGFVSLALKYGRKPGDAVEAVEFLSTKIGLAIVVLGMMHFFNMLMLSKYRYSKFFGVIAAKKEPAEDAALPASPPMVSNILS